MYEKNHILIPILIATLIAAFFIARHYNKPLEYEKVDLDTTRLDEFESPTYDPTQGEK